MKPKTQPKFRQNPDPYTGQPLCCEDDRVGNLAHPTRNTAGYAIAAVATIPSHIIAGWMIDLIARKNGSKSSSAETLDACLYRITNAMQNHLNHQPTQWESWDELFAACGYGHDNIRQYDKNSEKVRQANRNMRKREYMNGRALMKVRQTGDLAPWSHPLRHQGYIDAQIGIPEPDAESNAK